MTRKEAIEVVKERLDYYEREKRLKKACEILIPELAESDDERIRKEMVDYFSQYKDDGIRGVDITPWIAWLEKQKDSVSNAKYIEDVAHAFEDGRKKGIEEDQKPTEEILSNLPDYMPTNLSPYIEQKPAEIDEYEIIKKHITYDSLSSEVNKRLKECGWYFTEEPAKWIEEDIQKIRSEEYTKGFNDAAFGGKLKEWGVEDEDRIRQIERIAQQAGCTQKLQEEIHDWLKSLRPQPKQEWSDEDERKLQKCIKIVERWEEDYDIAYAPYSGMLKSLRPQSH